VEVSKETGRIVSLSLVSQFKTIYHAVNYACYLCEGEVSMPDKAIWSKGLHCPNKPGIAYEGRPFNIWVQPEQGSDDFTLKVECWGFMDEISRDGKKP